MNAKYSQHINQQTHPTKYNSWHVSNSNMFRHRGGSPRSLLEKRSTSTKRWTGYCIAHTGTNKILTF